VIRIVWMIALFIGWILTWLRFFMFKPVSAANYHFKRLESQAKVLAKSDEEFEDTFHRIALESVVINSLLKSDMKQFTAVVPFHQILERKLRVQRLIRFCVKTRPPAVFIVGLPRTGSTLLHQLCGTDGNARTVRAWEFRMPFEASNAPKDQKSRMEKVQKQLDGLYNLAPAIRNVHYVRALDPDECVQGFLDCAMPEWYLWGAIDAPEAFNWYVNGDMTNEYVNYEKFLRVLLENDGITDNSTRNLWLKTPHHTFKLIELAKAFPEAKFVWLHRDPSRSVGSCCSMNQAIMDVSSPWFVDPHVIGRRTLKRLAHCVEKGMADRKILESQGRNFVDVYYEDMKGDLLGTMKKMYRDLGFDDNFSVEYEASLTNLVSTSKSQETAHRYSLKDFGLSEESILCEFQPYLTEHFSAGLQIVSE
jgi:LPS sulfotransferase NodH